MSGSRKKYRFANDLGNIEPSSALLRFNGAMEFLAMLRERVAEVAKSQPSFLKQLVRTLFAKFAEAETPPGPEKVCAFGYFLDEQAEACEAEGNEELAEAYDQLWHEWEWWARACGTELAEFDAECQATYEAICEQLAAGKTMSEIVNEAISSAA